jgi:integrase
VGIYACGALAGLRIGETLALQRPDIRLAARQIHVARSVLQDGTLNPTPKGKKPRIVAMPVALVVLLTPVVEHATLWLFPGKRGQPRRYTAVWQALQRLAHQAGLPPMGTHVLRRSHGSQLAQRGAHPEFIRRQLGHENLAQTGVYTSFLPIDPPEWFHH